jgi:hypothetical protein
MRFVRNKKKWLSWMPEARCYSRCQKQDASQVVYLPKVLVKHLSKNLACILFASFEESCLHLVCIFRRIFLASCETSFEESSLHL